MSIVRALLPLLAASGLVLVGCGAGSTAFESHFDPSVERPWIGPEYWSNPLQDWRLREGRLENFRAGGDRNVFLLTREVNASSGTLSTSVRLGRIEPTGAPLENGWAGFRVGIRGSFSDYRDSAVRGVGLHCGLAADGRLFIGSPDDSSPIADGAFESDASLSLHAEPRETWRA